MKKQILERYERHADGRLIVEIAADRVDDLYNDYDKRANFLKKDLDEELALYITECVREIADEPFLIRIVLADPIDDGLMAKVTGSIRSYFLYMKELEVRKLGEMTRTSAILFTIGIVILTASILLNERLDAEASVMGSVFAEGLTVAAWVSLWESLATFLIHWTPRRRRIRLFESIAQSDVLFGFSAYGSSPSIKPII